MTGFLLDTNVISELRRPRPDRHVVAWFDTHRASKLYVSEATLAEIAVGIARVTDAAKRADLELWAKRDFLPWAAGRSLPASKDVLERWLILMHRAQARGVTLSQPDALIAATADTAGLVVVTRNSRDFDAAGVIHHNPFAG